MKVYEKMYYHLFNAITDALEALEGRNYGRAEELLKSAQQESEELFLEQKPRQKNPPADKAGESSV